MKTRLARLRVAELLMVVLAVAACGAGVGSEPGGTTPGTNPASPITSAMPPVGDPPPPGDPGELTVPQPGQVDVREIPADRLEADVEGRSVTIRITFTSGVEPCYVLDTIVVQERDRSFGLTLREGHGPGDMVCIEIAKTKHALVELGELEPGSYTVVDATGGAAPIEVVVA